MSFGPYAEVVVNVEAALVDTFHYHVPHDLRPLLHIGHFVEIEFGRRLAQGVVVASAETSPVEETKPVIGLIDPEPVLTSWQIELARWLSDRYLAPLNACIRLMLPPGLTRWADSSYDLNPAWDGSGQLTDVQRRLIELLQTRGDLRSRQITRALGGVDWQPAAAQLTRRSILRRASVLDPPRARPKELRTVELIAGPNRSRAALVAMGRPNKAADILRYLLETSDPLPGEATVLAATGAGRSHLVALEDAGLITRIAPRTVIVAEPGKTIPLEFQSVIARLPATPEDAADLAEVLPALESANLVRREQQPAAVGLAIAPNAVLDHILRLRGAEVYGRIVRLLASEARPVTLSEVYERTGATLQHVRRLAAHDLVRFRAEEVWRDSLADRDFAPVDPPELTLDQARAWGRIKVAMIEQEPEPVVVEVLPKNDTAGTGSPHKQALPEIDDDADTADASSPFLLHGVTGSGKTEIYMRAIDFALARGQRAVVLVPEIALTPQTVRRFAARFPGRVAVLHSGLSDGERYDTWRRARLGLFDIIIGPRSALFTPLADVGVIVVDEEHDASYKQTPPVPPPYYHAREAAIAVGRMIGATVIMGSATPDVVTYHRARAGRFRLLELPRRIMGHRQRIQGQAERLQLTTRYEPLPPADGEDLMRLDDALTIPLPPIQVVDMRQELRAGNRSVFSRALDQAISETLARGEQCILFLNRRGSATFVNCRDCGHVMNCTRCGIPLTYHRSRLELICHQCGRREPYPQVCPNCGSERIRFFGLGTEKLQELAHERWPEARLVRWDRDTTAAEGSHEAILAGFIDREADILIGTQMIAKGLDLPYVTLVGVVSADIALGLPDYNTGERAFQILSQVAGRAGRGILGGRVIIQTYQPDHYAVRAAADHDYAAFYVEEMRFRTRHRLPPFRQMARLLIADPVDDRARRQAEEMARTLKHYARENDLTSTEILGPTPAFFSRLDGRYRWHIVVHSPEPRHLLQEVRVPAPWVIDIDPESTL